MSHLVEFLLPNVYHLQMKLQEAVADPGFFWGVCTNSKKCYYFAYFLPKLHENERIWIPRGACVPGAPLDPPMLRSCYTGFYLSFCSERGRGRRGLHVTITQTWDLPPPPPPPDIGPRYLLPAPASPLDMGPRTSPSAAYISWWSVDTCPNLFTWGPTPHKYWHLVATESRRYVW